MKNSTQITFAFQDPPDSGENPGVGVRIKSLKKGGNTADKEAPPEDPLLFDEPNGDLIVNDQTKNPTVKSNNAGIESTVRPGKSITEIAHKSLNHTKTEGDFHLGKDRSSVNEIGAVNGDVPENVHSSGDDIGSLDDNSVDAMGSVTGDVEENIQSPNDDSSFLDNLSSDAIGSVDAIDSEDAIGSIDVTGSGNSYGSAEDDVSVDNDDSADNDNSVHLDVSADLRNSVNLSSEIGDDADLPVFRGTSLKTDLSDPELSNTVYPEGEEIESEPGSLDVNEQDNSNNLPGKSVKSTRGRKSLKTIDEGAELINIPPDEILFKKQYYAIGEVAEMFHVNQSLLRFWETEFDIIQPRKNRKGDRHFRPVDIKNLLLIHDLLRRRKLTIEGAKDFLKKNKRSPERFAMIQSLQKIKGFILEIKATL